MALVEVVRAWRRTGEPSEETLPGESVTGVRQPKPAGPDGPDQVNLIENVVGEDVGASKGIA